MKKPTWFWIVVYALLFLFIAAISGLAKKYYNINVHGAFVFITIILVNLFILILKHKSKFSYTVCALGILFMIVKTFEEFYKITSLTSLISRYIMIAMFLVVLSYYGYSVYLKYKNPKVETDGNTGNTEE